LIDLNSPGEEIPAATVVWRAGMRANPLTRLFPVGRDHFGRIPVDELMRVKGVPTDLSAVDRESPGNPRGGRADRAAAPGIHH